MQPIEAVMGAEEFLKVPLRGTFKNSSGFYNRAKGCKSIRIILSQTSAELL